MRECQPSSVTGCQCLQLCFIVKGLFQILNESHYLEVIVVYVGV